MGRIFISYRRKDASFALYLETKLTEHLADDIFIDRKITTDDYVVALESEVKICDVFVLVVTENTFDPVRIAKKTDWIRREIRIALDLKKPIALAVWGDTPLPTNLPAEISVIAHKQAVPFYPTYMPDGVEKLARHCVNISGNVLGFRVPKSRRSRFPDDIPPVPPFPPMPTYEEEHKPGLIWRFWNALFKS